MIAPGKLADIVIWNSDPLADITVLQRPSEISTIIKDGRVVAREASGFSQPFTPSRLRRRRLRCAPVTRVDLGKYFLQRSRRHPQVGKAGHAGRGDVVALHQLHLASRDRRGRQQLADGSDDLP